MKRGAASVALAASVGKEERRLSAFHVCESRTEVMSSKEYASEEMENYLLL